MSTSTVAAILTVLGYSIYDTIIIFDRIRENIPLMRRAPFATIANVSLWETIRRSLATTFITLLPVASLFFFGGDDAAGLRLRAARRRLRRCVLVDLHRSAAARRCWKEREPEYARRRDEEAATSRATAPARRCSLAAEQAAAAEPAPDLSPVAAVERAVAGQKRSASGAASAGARGRMAEPGKRPDATVVEQLLLAVWEPSR